MDQWVELVFSTDTALDLLYDMLKGHSGISKNLGTSIWNLSYTLHLEKFHHGISNVAAHVVKLI